jgi:HSP20 family protein
MDTHTNVNVSKWNPFKFMRKTPDEKRSAPLRGDVAPNVPADWLLPARYLLPDPSRMLQSFFIDPIGGGKLENWFGDFSPNTFQPRIDVVEDSDSIRIAAEVPGLAREDLHVAIENGSLVLRGEKKLESSQDEKGCYRIERAFGRFERMVPLPDGLEVDRAETRFDKGVLTIRIPKSKTADKTATRELKIN